MADVNKQSSFSLFSRDTAALLLIDHQIGLLTGVRDMSVAELKRNVLALAKSAQVLGLPIVVTATAPDGMWGPTMPELTAAFPDIAVINRTTINSWDEPKFVEAVKATGWKQLLIAGLSLQVCATFAALSAARDGYEVRVIVDASGEFSEAGRITGIQRLAHAGVVVTNYEPAIYEMLKDNADPKAQEVYAALDIGFAVQVAQLQGVFAKAK